MDSDLYLHQSVVGETGQKMLHDLCIMPYVLLDVCRTKHMLDHSIPFLPVSECPKRQPTDSHMQASSA